MTQSQHVLQELYESYTKAAVNIISYYEMPERKNKLKELRDLVQNNCVQNKKLKSAETIKNRLLDIYNDEDDDSTEIDIESIIQQYKQTISEIDIDVSNDDNLIEFDKQVEALLDKIGNEANDEDAEMQLTGGYINVIDPISKKRIVDPVKNTLCGHTYDRDSITQILKINKKTRCPVVGCKSKEFVLLSHLRTDIVTKTYLEKNPA
ncbi:E3 SUMO-protein ligase NSE2 [Megachile rotundata]|uniref:E3 SUMO-protein ligase NSE2 n=1 Tax=Megachile rotundata TaxID=143995 RepID=UPI000258E566|nr:PREDICTED: E3 SUMO-protein ligase NSE2-like [Megachile rotundata]XP_012142354.1 PREDICTED: E3 SUMO-protein ligase NSE2-like [Megachile rotundata]XP_012142355.1 PREDICTED: E3 SUMO-protein ligase NSE2-like [Megachile rotundata]XP_012142356.1 PREDICTED: E3 SUMO-protein ligase NSE2-like [Megachile rotundata]